MFMAFVLAALAVGYMTFVLCYSKIGEPVRKRICNCGGPMKTKLREVLICPFCTGFWMAIIFEIVFRIDYLNVGILGMIAAVPALAMLAGWIALKTGEATDTIPKIEG